MLRKLRALVLSPGAWAAALVLGTPWLAQAQQSGLFPLAPIQRERVPCPAEDPVYELYRREYFGYHPTCWRPFPAGWGCPTPLAANVAQEFKERPRGKPPEIGMDELEGEGPPGDMGPDPGAEPESPPPAQNGGKPPLPSGRSPFELDTGPTDPNPKGASTTPEKPAAAVRTAPTSNPDPSNFNPPPLEFTPEKPKDTKPAAGPGLPPISQIPIPRVSSRSSSVPVRSSTSLMPLPDAAPTTSASNSLRPLTDAPTTAVTRTSAASRTSTPIPAPMYGNFVDPSQVPPDAIPVSQPVQAPRRTSFLGNLFRSRK
ncbi:hypothetical protein [Singulisphaera sp. PoT]|uniref:hypothetical protein n=1 Tax=Singulisphaera sp. PoT TaxID=3411797 RepID=UPI003BF50EB9